MNIEATRDVNAAKKELSKLLKKIKKYKFLRKEQIATFEKSQKQWENYAQTYVRFASSHYEGGSMRPLVEANILQRLYENKIKELKEDLKNMEPL